MRKLVSSESTLLGSFAAHQTIHSSELTPAHSNALKNTIADDTSTNTSNRIRRPFGRPKLFRRYFLTSSEPPLGGAAKRSMDLVVASLALLLFSPVMLIIYLLIRITDGPAIYVHPRIGHNARPFGCYKFRTMAVNADETLFRHLSANAEAAEEWRTHRKLRRDPRVSTLGHILRKSSLDELPQLFNVLNGDMSCVGPRPIPTEELPNYGSAVDHYYKARPGMTGIWQISGRNKLEYSQRVALDCEYIRNWSIGTDIIILSKTAFVVLSYDETS